MSDFVQGLVQGLVSGASLVGATWVAWSNRAPHHRAPRRPCSRTMTTWSNVGPLYARPRPYDWAEDRDAAD